MAIEEFNAKNRYALYNLKKCCSDGLFKIGKGLDSVDNVRAEMISCIDFALSQDNFMFSDTTKAEFKEAIEASKLNSIIKVNGSKVSGIDEALRIAICAVNKELKWLPFEGYEVKITTIRIDDDDFNNTFIGSMTGVIEGGKINGYQLPRDCLITFSDFELT
nr:hypothetical protein [Vibrio sp. 04Ya108]